MGDRAAQQLRLGKSVPDAPLKGLEIRRSASLDRFEEPVTAPCPEKQHRPSGRAEHDAICPSDQVFIGNKTHAADLLRQRGCQQSCRGCRP